MKTKLVCLCLFLFVSVFSLFAQELYKWKDAKGQWHIGQGPGGNLRPLLRVSVERVNYENRFLRIEGTVENISPVVITKPRPLNIRVSDVSQNVTFEERSVWAAGGYGKKIGGGPIAVFTTTLMVPDKARGQELKIDITTDDYPTEVDWKQRETLRAW